MLIKCWTGAHLDAPTGIDSGEHTIPTATSIPARASFLTLTFFMSFPPVHMTVDAYWHPLTPEHGFPRIVFSYRVQSYRGNPFPYTICAMLRAAHGQTVRCPLPGKCPLMQAWRPLAGHIAQKP